MNASGIYAITNTVSGKCYVGSAVHLGRRINRHQNCLRHNKHGNLHLQSAFNKYGEGKFIFKALIVCAKDNLIFYEQRAIDCFDSFKSGYNKAPIAGSQLGLKMSDLTKAKMQEAAKWRPAVTEETKRKLRLAQPVGAGHNRGNKDSIETRQKKSLASKGRPKSDAMRAKLSASKTGVPRSEETKEKLRRANLGKRHSEESKIKRSVSGKVAWQHRKAQLCQL